MPRNDYTHGATWGRTSVCTWKLEFRTLHANLPSWVIARLFTVSYNLKHGDQRPGGKPDAKPDGNTSLHIDLSTDPDAVTGAVAVVRVQCA